MRTSGTLLLGAVVVACSGGASDANESGSHDDGSGSAPGTESADDGGSSGPGGSSAASDTGATSSIATTASGSATSGSTSSSGAATTSADGTTSGGATTPSVDTMSGTSGCVDSCPFAAGVQWQCEQRFMYGVNYAWHHFAGDFGGISPWGQSGVAGDLATHRQKLMDMRAHGVSTIRWWMFPDFRGDGVTFDGNEAPTGLGATTEADIEAALDLAAEADVYLMLTLFSFDNFRPSRDVSGIWTPGITPIALDAGKRGMLVANVVGPVARVVEASANSDRVIAWDVINEPEWAITGASPYGDMDYTPNGELDAVTHGQMETFVADVIAQLRADSSALITVGGAAAKWAQAWTRVDVDFYQLHIYGWVHDYWPYTSSPAQLGLTDKPLVMGELPLGDLAPGESYLDVVTSFYGNGYAGALGWHYDEATTGQLDDVAIFAGMHPCETSY